jgi:hypothetical protein
MSIEDDKKYTTTIKTTHYTFDLNYVFRRLVGKPYTSVHISVGEVHNPCLSISLPFAMNDSMDPEKRIGTINHIKKLRTCLGEDVPDHVWEKHSLSKEILDKAVYCIKKDFPYIKHLTLTDDSQMMCHVEPLDTFDLLYYYVALYKKTWYEQSWNAYFLPRERFIEYKCEVERYASNETKQLYTWEFLETLILNKGTSQAYESLKANQEQYKNLFKNAHTLPDFFKEMAHTIPRKDKCAMFRGWLPLIIEKFTGKIPRDWIIDIYQFQKGGKYRKTRSNRIGRHGGII